MAHVLAQDLRDAILQAAIQGKLTEQNSNDFSAYELVSDAKNALSNDTIDGQRVKKKEIVSLSEDDIEFEIPDNWCWIRLGSVCVIARGGSPRPIKSYITNREDGINWIKIGDTEKNGKYISSTKEKIIPEGMKKSRFVHAGDFLLTNSMSFGRPYILKTDGCIHDGWLVISQPTEVFNKDYLYYLLSSGYAYKQFSDLTSGAVVQNLNSDKVANAVFPVPPIEEQARIVARIDELMAKIDEYETIEKELTELQKAFPRNMKDAILQAAMQGKLTEQLESDSEVDYSLLKAKNYSKLEEELELPESWINSHLEDVTKPLSTKPYQILESEIKSTGKYPVISQSKQYSIGFSDEESKVLRHDKKLVAFGDHTTIVKTVDFPFVVGADGVKLFEATSNILPDYLYLCLTYYANEITDKGGYSRHYKFLKNKSIPLPPIEEQQRIVDKLDQLLPLCEQLERMSS